MRTGCSAFNVKGIYCRILGRSRLTLERKFAAVPVGLLLAAQFPIGVMVLSSSLKDCCQKGAGAAAISKQLISHTRVTLTSTNDLRPPGILKHISTSSAGVQFPPACKSWLPLGVVSLRLHWGHQWLKYASLGKSIEALKPDDASAQQCTQCVRLRSTKFLTRGRKE